MAQVMDRMILSNRCCVRLEPQLEHVRRGVRKIEIRKKTINAVKE